MKNNFKSTYLSSILLSSALLISNGVESSDFQVSPFIASYYVENDGRSPGQGNNGTDPNIVPELVQIESAPYPSINYSWRNLYGIDAHNFHGVWEGSIEVFSPLTTVNMNFSVSWSDVKLYLDDELIHDWRNYDKDVQLTLSQGVHNIRVEHHNHWHTAGFNVSFIQYPQLSVADAASFGDIELLTTEDTKIVYVSGYEANTRYNEAAITIPEYDGSVILFLSSYNAINWVLNNPNNTDIAAVIFDSYKISSTIQNNTTSPVFQITDLNRNVSQGSLQIQTLTGRTPDYTYSQYNLSEVIIPVFEE